MIIICDSCQEEIAECDNCGSGISSGMRIVCDNDNSLHYCCPECYMEAEGVTEAMSLMETDDDGDTDVTEGE